MKWTVLVGVAGLAVAGAFVGCGSSDEGGAAGAAGSGAAAGSGGGGGAGGTEGGKGGAGGTAGSAGTGGTAGSAGTGGTAGGGGTAGTEGGAGAPTEGGAGKEGGAGGPTEGGAGTEGGTGGSEGGSAASLKNDVQPLFDAKCKTCHNGTVANPDLSSTAKSILMVNKTATIACSGNTILVVAGDSAKSVLVNRIAAAGCGSGQMPTGGTPYTAAEIQKIKDWIDQGAKDN